MLLEKPKLFGTLKEFLLVMGLLSLILISRLTLLHNEYSEFIAKPFYYTQAMVLQQYTKYKNGKSYEVLKLHSIEGYDFYTTAHLKTNLKGYRVRVKLMPDEGIKFREYLRAFFIKAKIKKVYEKIEADKNYILDKIASQHQNSELISFYQAIFLATPLSKTLREKIASLGVSHLVALSGFHLTILWGLIYGLLLLFYQPLQQRYFPYRYSLIDLGIITIILLGLYLWFVDFPPSLVRSYAMLSIAWVILLLGIELLSFEFLGAVVMLLLALFPKLIASLSFWFSVSGVFYIYLLLYWGKNYHKYILSFIFIPFGIFILMLPIVHSIFGVTTLWQLLSPILSIIFILFYPLVIGLHLINLGGLLDGLLLWLFALPNASQEHILAVEFVALYILFSLGAIKSKILFILTLLVSFLYLGYLFIN